jgi:hypothetical protein
MGFYDWIPKTNTGSRRLPILKQYQEEVAEKMDILKGKRTQSTPDCPDCARLRHDNESLRYLVNELIEVICRLKSGDCDPDALAQGFDETGG